MGLWLCKRRQINYIVNHGVYIYYILSIYTIYSSPANKLNLEKHKVCFEEVQEIWNDPDLLILPARKRGEKRRLAIGKVCAVVFSVVHTMRGESIRIISARRATAKEVRRYEQGKNER